jgi:hypothetical protein
MSKVTLENLDTFGIGRDYTGKVYPQDIEHIVYGNDIEGNLTLEDPETKGGTVPFWKEPSNERWWKMAPRPSE